MRVIIPVAGSGTRLRPHTFSTPKPLLSVAGKAILAHILDPISRLSPTEVILVVGHMGEQIIHWVSNTYSFPTRFVQQDKLLGLGYAVKIAMETVGSDPLLVVLGDTIADCDLKAFTSAGAQVLGLRKVDDPQRFGIAEISNGVIKRLEEKPEKPASDLAVIGLYYFADGSILAAALDRLIASGRTTRGEIQLTDALQSMIQEGSKFTPFEVKNWYDCGKRETMLETNRHLLQSLATDPTQAHLTDSSLIPPVYIDKRASIASSVIGPNVSVDAGATIRNCRIENSIISEGATLTGLFIKNSLVGPRTSLSRQAEIVNIGEESSIGFE